jgi:WD40 repeat protein
MATARILFVLIALFTLHSIAIAQMDDIVWARSGHVGELTALAFMPDGSAVSGGLDATIRVWDLATHRMTRIVPTGGIGIRGLAVSADGSRAAAADNDGFVRIFDATRWTLLRRVGGGDIPQALDVALSGDGSLLVAGYADGTARIVATAGGEILGTLDAGKSAVGDVDITRDGRLVATADDDYTTKLWDAATGAPLRTIQEVQYPATSVAFSADGSLLACIGASREDSFTNRAVIVVDVASGRVLHRVHSGYNTAVTSVAFSPDGRYIASTAGDYDVPGTILTSTIMISDLQGSRGSWALKQRNEDQWINVAAFTPDGRHIVWGNPTGALRIGTLSDSNAPAIVEPDVPFVSSHLRPVRAIARSGSMAYSGDAGGVLAAHELGSADRHALVRAHTMAITSIALSADSMRVITGSEDGSVKIWTADSLRLQRTLYLSAEWPVASVAMLRDGRIVAAIGAFDSVVVLLDSSSSEPVRLFRGNTTRIMAMAVSPDESLLATAAADGSVLVWEVATGLLVHSVQAHAEAATALAFTPDGARLFCGGASGRLASIDVASGALDNLYDAHTHAITAVAVARDASLMLTSGADSTMLVWTFDAEGAQIARRYDYPAVQNAIALDEARGRFLSAGEDASVIEWRLSTHASVAVPGVRTASLRLDVRIDDRNATATIDLSLARAAACDVALFDLFGRRIATIASGRFDAGVERFDVALTTLATGFYFVRGTSGGDVRSSPLRIVR